MGKVRSCVTGRRRSRRIGTRKASSTNGRRSALTWAVLSGSTPRRKRGTVHVTARDSEPMATSSTHRRYRRWRRLKKTFDVVQLFERGLLSKFNKLVAFRDLVGTDVSDLRFDHDVGTVVLIPRCGPDQHHR